MRNIHTTIAMQVCLYTELLVFLTDRGESQVLTAMAEHDIMIMLLISTIITNMK
jgi:hypothetical protein